MPLQPGTTLGPYKVTAKIGEAKNLVRGVRLFRRSTPQNDISWGNLIHSVFHTGIHRDDIHSLGPGQQGAFIVEVGLHGDSESMVR